MQAVGNMVLQPQLGNWSLAEVCSIQNLHVQQHTVNSLCKACFVYQEICPYSELSV